MPDEAYLHFVEHLAQDVFADVHFMLFERIDGIVEQRERNIAQAYMPFDTFV